MRIQTQGQSGFKREKGANLGRPQAICETPDLFQTEETKPGLKFKQVVQKSLKKINHPSSGSLQETAPKPLFSFNSQLLGRRITTAHFKQF